MAIVEVDKRTTPATKVSAGVAAEKADGRRGVFVESSRKRRNDRSRVVVYDRISIVFLAFEYSALIPRRAHLNHVAIRWLRYPTSSLCGDKYSPAVHENRSGSPLSRSSEFMHRRVFFPPSQFREFFQTKSFSLWSNYSSLFIKVPSAGWRNPPATQDSRSARWNAMARSWPP